MRLPAFPLVPGIFVVLLPSLAVAADAPPARREGKFQFRAEPLSYSYFIRSPQERHPRLAFAIDGESAGEVRAARVLVTRAEDDTGRDIRNSGEPKFLRIAVGSISREEHLRPIPPKIECTLAAVAPKAKALKRVEGTVELVIPARNAEAIAVIADVPAHATGPVDSGNLRKAGITLEILDRQAYDARMRTFRDQTGGLTDYGVGLFYPASMLAAMPPEARASLLKVADQQLARIPLPKLRDRDFALGIHDPEERLVGIEFVAGDNSRVIYNRNGWAHYENNEQKKRLAIYRLEQAVPGDLKLICWLAIDKSLVRIPFEMIDLPLPPYPPANEKASTPPAAIDAP